MFHTLPSVNCCCFSFREVKTSERETPSMSSITIYILSPVIGVQGNTTQLKQTHFKVEKTKSDNRIVITAPLPTTTLLFFPFRGFSSFWGKVMTLTKKEIVPLTFQKCLNVLHNVWMGHLEEFINWTAVTSNSSHWKLLVSHIICDITYFATHQCTLIPYKLLFYILWYLNGHWCRQWIITVNIGWDGIWASI